MSEFIFLSACESNSLTEGRVFPVGNGGSGRIGVLADIPIGIECCDVDFSYDRMGRQVTVADGQGTRTFYYDTDTLALTNETIAASTYTNIITRSYDSYGRADITELGSDYRTSYAYSDLGRFAAVTSAVISVTSVVDYAYLANSDLIEKRSVDTIGMTNSMSYEGNRDLITEVLNKVTTNVIAKYEYTSDVLGRRTQRLDTLASLTTNDFIYNNRSEITNALFSTNSYEYTFDNIGNRETAQTATITNTYVANSLNQYYQYYQHYSIPPTNTIYPTYDNDGNLLTMYNYGAGDVGVENTWDAENRLIKVVTGNPVTSEYYYMITNSYDYMGRRYKKVVYDHNGTNWNVVETNLYVYDGWNLIQRQMRMPDGDVYDYYFTWGLDLSGTLQGAGGVGGLLSVTRAGRYNATNTFYYVMDGNGNVAGVVQEGTSTLVCEAEYDAFGKLTSYDNGDDFNNEQPFRFSTKYYDHELEDNGLESGIYYYLGRWYHPDLGRWWSRDPIGELGGLNLYGFVNNNAINQIDPIGYSSYDSTAKDDQGRMVNVDECNIVIYVGHASLLPGDIVNSPASMASTVSCDPDAYLGDRSGAPNIGVPLPGYKPLRKPPPTDSPYYTDLFLQTRPQRLSPDEIRTIANQDFATAQAKAPSLCDDDRACCNEITITISCRYLGWHPFDWPLRSELSDICGKTDIYSCPDK